MSRYFVKPIVCDYGVYEYGKKEMVCMCNIRTNAEIIADVLNADSDVECAHYYPAYPHAKFICRKINEAKGDKSFRYAKEIIETQSPPSEGVNGEEFEKWLREGDKE